MVLMGARKGVRTICNERGFDLKGELKLPALREWLAAQEDFAAVKPEIQIFLESHSHVLVFNPKCTPETTWCELGWAFAKSFTSRFTKENLADLRALVEFALSPDHTTAASVNKNYQHSMKWWRAYAVQEDPFAAWEEVLNAPAVSSIAAITHLPSPCHRLTT
jgi:hypothetical protein